MQTAKDARKVGWDILPVKHIRDNINGIGKGKQVGICEYYINHLHKLLYRITDASGQLDASSYSVWNNKLFNWEAKHGKG